MTTLDRHTGKLDPAHAAPKKTPHQGQGAKQTSERNDTALAHDLSHIVKPEIDLMSWASLGGNIKPSRACRKHKRTWRRDAP
jgi:hypothetical protein